jgi:hypothetical protein
LDWFEPSDTWPKHRYSEADRALEEARHAGWWLKGVGASAHGYAVPYCRRTTSAEFCRFVVLTTAGTNSEDTAHRIREKVARCQHHGLQAGEAIVSEPVAALTLRGAHFHMDRAERLIAAIDGVLTHHELRGRADALLDSAITATDDAGRLLADAQQQDENAAATADAAHRDADAYGMGGAPWPPEDLDARLVRPAENDLRTARGLLEEGTGQLARTATERLSTLRSRLDESRAQRRGRRP